MNAPLETGLVVTGHGRHYVVESADGTRRICHPRGKKSQAVVGDRLQWRRAQAGQGDDGMIEAILERRNLFYRQDAVRTKAFAANIDQVLVLLAADPVFSEWQLAKALVAAEAAGIEAVIGLNKQDLAPAYAAAWQRLAAYRQPVPTAPCGEVAAEAASGPQACRPLYPVLRLSLADPDGGTDYAALCERLRGRATLVLGPSGVGKSTLINRLVPNAQAQTAEISRALNSGRHTTTTTTWYWVDRASGTAVLDSPGFQEFGLHHIRRRDLARWMPDIACHAKGCRFHNCTHIHEPGCVVRAAVLAEDAPPSQPGIAASRYALYQSLLLQLPD
ncbi:GTPase RsgA [Lampropedia cohaerens]|uniref:Small ribosomal subunit biogenesis GTPase RsgA n=1 Tax=Lampropedia cohaerens TaxID=1610491 RepID=A0A0U1PWU5_9BURK|nr:ribosome small subunit-dependent GTPase A [Lampropedia cohaerens]KKW67012.1 GTPase RsgA [Lampropedia cohaerens]